MPKVFEFLRAFQRAIKSRKQSPVSQGGVDLILDGRTAIATLEAGLAEACCTGGSQSVEAGVRVWFDEQLAAREGDDSLSVVQTAGPRAAFAAARGLSLSGSRAVLFLGGKDVLTVADQARNAAREHLPLVVYVLGQPDAACMQGFVQFGARNVQEAVDLGLAARLVAEQALVPVFVVLDECSVATSVQDVNLPTPEEVQSLLGSAQDHVESASPAQVQLFGAQRARVPARFDLERGMLSGARGVEFDRLGAVSERAFMGPDTEVAVASGLQRVGEITGRSLSAFSTFMVEGAKTLYLAQGAVIETVERIAKLNGEKGDANEAGIGVIGLRQVTPLPPDLLDSLGGRSQVIVLEGPDPGHDRGCLSTALRAEMARAIENGRHNTGSNATAWSTQDLPRVKTAYIADGEVCACDLQALESEARSVVRLSVAAGAAASAFPKRQVLLDRLERDYPAASALGLVPSPCTRPDFGQMLSLGVQDEAVSASLISLVGGVLGGRIRSRVGGEDFDSAAFGDAELRHQDGALPVDALFVSNAGILTKEFLVRRLNSGAKVFFAGHGTDSVELDAGFVEHHKSRDIQLFGGLVCEDAAEQMELSIGGFLALLDSGDRDVPLRKALSIREQQLSDKSESDVKGMLETMERGHEGLKAIEAVASDAGQTEKRGAPDKVAEQTQASATGLESLARFWGETGIVHDSASESLTPEPRLAMRSLPPLSAAFRDLSADRKGLPVFDPAACSDCGDCWTVCPDGAIAPVALDWASILDAGFAMAKDRGAGVDALRPAIGKLAKQATKLMGKGDAGNLAGPILQTAFDDLIDRLASNEERRDALTSAFAGVLAEVKDLQVARTAACFDRGEEIFSLAINPSTCKACGACVQACDGEGLISAPQTPERLSSAREAYRLWENLPDTAGSTVARLIGDPDVGRAAAILMSRHCLLAMSGGTSAEPGSGEQLALRHAMAATEFHLQPALLRRVKEVDALIEKVREQVRECLIEALPDDDAGALESALAAGSDRHVDIADFLAGASSKGQGKTVDRVRIERLHRLQQRLTDLRDRLVSGASGSGRARSSLVIADGAIAEWAAAFPYNPFPMPVAVDDSGEAADLARGLVEGQLRAVVEDFRVQRLAEIELKQPNQAKIAEMRLRSLTFEDLSPEEQAQCPPLVLVGGDRVLGGRCLSAVANLLASRLPVKVLSLSELDMGLDRSGAPNSGASDGLAMMALLERNAYVAQSSVGAADHLMGSMLGALAHPGPALVQVHAPSPSRHGFSTCQTVTTAKAAVASRSLCLFRFDPGGEGTFGTLLDLDGNAAMESPWVENDGLAMTPAHWALGERRFAAHLVPLQASDPAPTPLVEWLALARGERAGKTPFVETEAGESVAVQPALAQAADQRLLVWQTLQEMAGIVTPFTSDVQSKAEAQVAAQHKSELEALQGKHAAEMQDVRDATQAELTTRLRDRLVELSLKRRQAAVPAGSDGGPA